MISFGKMVIGIGNQMKEEDSDSIIIENQVFLAAVTGLCLTTEIAIEKLIL